MTIFTVYSKNFDVKERYQPEFPISTLSFCKTIFQTNSRVNRPSPLAHCCVAIEPRLAVLLSGFVYVSPSNSLLADTPPYEMASERSIRCLSWFASFVASLSGGTIDTRKGRLQNTMRRLRGHKLRSPRKRLARTGRWDFRKGDAGCPNRYVISNQRQ